MTTVTFAAVRDITPRLYQEIILATCVKKNTLVVLPTGMGKTAIALLLALHRMQTHPGSKVLFLAPTKPLCEQHISTFRRHLDAPDDMFSLFTGSVPPAKRAAQWKTAQFIFSTPQGLENDIMGSSISLEDCSLIIFDEAHRATGDYSYVFLAQQYNTRAKFPHILALTASPGSEVEKVMEVCTNLKIEQVEVRTPDDPDVQPYVQEVDIRPIRVQLTPDMEAIRKLLIACMRSKVEELRKAGLTKLSLNLSKRELLGMQAELRAKMTSGEHDYDTMRAISVGAEAMKVQHALELLESQGLSPLMEYFAKLRAEAAAGQSKAVKNLMVDEHWKGADIKTQHLADTGVEHPKVEKVQEICKAMVAANPKAKIIVFTQYRDTASKLKQVLSSAPGVLPEVFVGQQKKKGIGLSQKQQVELLQQFGDGLFNVLLATCVAEEGLDIPTVDLVLFYEPVPSAIRTIQRRGRTGRHEAGKVMTLITQGTRDEAFAASAKYKERNMNVILQDLRATLNKKLLQQPQATLARYENTQPRMTKTGPKIYIDYREKASGTAKELLERGAQITLEMLHVGDYIVSERCGIEFKTQDDFLGSMIDGRLLEQLKHLRKGYERPLIIVEGDKDLYTLRNIHPNAIRGMLAAITVTYGIPMLWSKTPIETAQLIMTIAEREQNETTNSFSPHANRKPLTLAQQQEYIVSALPQVGLQLAQELLKKFGSVQAVLNASIDDLKAVEGVGDKKASVIIDIARSKYGN